MGTNNRSVKYRHVRYLAASAGPSRLMIWHFDLKRQYSDATAQFSGRGHD